MARASWAHTCVRALLKQGCEVLCVDNYLHRSQRNIVHCTDDPRFEVIRHDVTFPLYVEVDEIYNLACPASPIHYQYDPVQTTKTSMHRRHQHARLGKRVKGAILQASTSEVYGRSFTVTHRPKATGAVNPIGTRSCYDEGKRCAETLFFDYHRQHRVPIRVARIFNTYGPRMLPNDGRVVSNFIIQALKGEPITVYGNGSQTRSFCYVDDLIDGLMRLMNVETTFPGAVNLGNPASSLSRNSPGSDHLPHRIALEASITGRCLRTTRDNAAPISVVPESCSKWQPRVPLETGLKRTIAYFEPLIAQKLEHERKLVGKVA